MKRPKKRRRKKKKKQDIKAGGANLDEVDVTYDTDFHLKTLDIQDAKVKDRWSRYIGAMGIEAVKKQANAEVLISGLNGLGVEIAKNIVLSGVKRLSLHDSSKTEWTDLSG